MYLRDEIVRSGSGECVSWHCSGQGGEEDRGSSCRDLLCFCGAGKTDEGADVIGVRFETVYKRNYPNGSLACHLLGYTASGNVGQGGIEGYYNDYLNGVDVKEGEIVVLENVRVNKGEKKNDPELGKKYAALCDVFVMDAFGTAHRAQASTYGVAEFAPIACAGPLLAAELDALGKALKEPARPMVAIVGGSKVSTKLEVLNSLSKIADQIIVGGGIANTFIAAAGHNVGKSLYEADLIPVAKELAASTDIPVPVDVRVGTEFSETAPATEKSVTEVKDDESIFDIGDKSAEQLTEIIKNAKTVLWNGPVGVFEFPNFRKGTEIISHAIANSDAFSIAGGGDTLAAIDLFGIADKISYISTGGGAFLEFVEGKVLPAVEILEKRANG